MKKHIISLSALLLLVSCQREEVFAPAGYKQGFMAEIEEFAGATRTSLDGNNSIRWSENDRIAVFQGSSAADVFEVSAESVGKTKGNFREVMIESGDFVSGNEIPDNVAVYPYSEDMECVIGMADEDNAYRIWNVHFPASQYYESESFPDDAFVMVAVTGGINDRTLKFRNASGAIRLRIKGSVKVKTISITGNDNEPIAGYATVIAYKDSSSPVIERSDIMGYTVNLYCEDGVQLDENTPTEFILALPPTDFEKGFTIRITDVSGDVYERSTDKRNSVRRSRILNMPEITFGEDLGPDYSDAIDLNADGTAANSYIISEANTYRFNAVKGNSSESVGAVADVEVLWETFNTSETPYEGELIAEVGIDDDGAILFSTADVFCEGNAVIAAKDASGKILWSWHIWFTDQPQEHIYRYGAGTMMDRNLGATSATPGDPGALGLLYQWGRKDPFLGASDINLNAEAASTAVWPDVVRTDPSVGTISYTISHPMTFIEGDDDYGDWVYDGYYSDPAGRWAEEKTIYDPCPSGWRVPDGGFTGVWNRAGFDAWSFDVQARGMFFSIESPALTWYPASAYKLSNRLYDVGSDGSYWAYNDYLYASHSLYFYEANGLVPYSAFTRSYAMAVRCFKEGSESPLIAEHEAVSLHPDGETANSYIVTRSGNYKFKAVAGNSNGALRDAVMVDVLWESFGTDVYPERHDLIKFAYYTDSMVIFSTADTFREGNAVIAARDIDGEILWSWHIWFTDQPEEHIYNNGAGTMMDRNLGATSATPGDPGALGLLYQWGRKDPFLGSSVIYGVSAAKSTMIEWPAPEVSDAETGTIEYSVFNPTTFIKQNDYNNDWFYTGSSSTDDSRWSSDKTIYDPCPAGWRVPDGEADGLWGIAGFADTYFDSYNYGISFDIYYPAQTWYPASGYRSAYDGSLYMTGNKTYLWSASGTSLYYDATGDVWPSRGGYRAYGNAVRCFKIGSCEYVAVQGVSLNSSYEELEIGDRVTLYATVTPADATDVSVSWSTSNSSVATVENGVVTARGAGSARITVTTNDGGYTDYCDVVVLSGFDSDDERLDDDGDTDWD